MATRGHHLELEIWTVSFLRLRGDVRDADPTTLVYSKVLYRKSTLTASRAASAYSSSLGQPRGK
jgi:hypothetical protein